MKRIVKIVAPLILVLSLAMTAVAVGEEAPQDPKAKLANLECKIKQNEADQARIPYRAAKENFEELVRVARQGAAAERDLRDAQIAMLKLEIEYKKKQLEADTCFANLKNDPANACNALINKLYQLEDELESRTTIEKLAEKTLTKVREGRGQGVYSSGELRDAQAAYDSAVKLREGVQLAIEVQQLKIADIPNCKDKVKTPQERKKAELPPEQGGQPPTAVTSAPEEPPTTTTTMTTTMRPTITNPTETTLPVPVP